MDDASIKKFVDRIAAHFQSWEFEDLHEMVADPLILFSETAFRATLNGDDIIRMAKHFRVVMQDLGAANASVSVDEIVWQSSDRVRIRAILSYSDPYGALLARTVVRYYCTGVEADNLTVEIIEYISPGLPGTVNYFQGSLSLH